VNSDEQSYSLFIVLRVTARLAGYASEIAAGHLVILAVAHDVTATRFFILRHSSK